MPVTTGRPLSWSFMELSLVCCLLGGQAQYEAFINAVNEDLCMEYDGPRHDDSCALEVIRKCLGVNSGTVLQRYARRESNEALRKLKDEWLTVRQIERLTGINRNIVQKA